MSSIAYMDLIAIVACVLAAVFLIRGRKRAGFLAAIPNLLFVLLVLMAGYRTVLFLEWSGITTGLDWMEDFGGVFIPFTWAFVFYAFVKNAVEDDLRASRERFRALIESTSDWMWESDSQGVFTYSSPQVEDQLGYGTREILGRPMFDYMAAPNDGQFRVTFNEAVRQAMVIFQEPIYFRSRDRGTPCLEISAVPIVDQHGRLTGYRGVNRDVTERMRAKDALHESTVRLQSVFDSSPLAITVTDLDGTALDCSQAALETYGLASKADVLGKSVFGFIAEEDRDWARTKMAELLRDGLVRDVECTLLRKDGTEFPGLLSASLMRDRDGRPSGLVGISVDITARKRAEANLVAYQRRLRSLASELSLAEERERRRIAAGLHDFACQNLVLSKMKLQGLHQPELLAGMDEIAAICKTLDRTIESVRGLVFDLSSPTLYKFGLEAALEELLEDKLKVQHGIQCTFHHDGAPKPLAEDVRVLLFQSVRELLINIVKHAQAHSVTVDVTRSNDSIKIVVTDDGVGFNVADILADSSRNRGFGLFHIKERLDFIGGRLEIESQSGQGSRFVLLAHLEVETDAVPEADEGHSDVTG